MKIIRSKNNINKVKLETITSKIGDGLHGTPIFSNDGDYYFINGNNLNKIINIKKDTKRISSEESHKYLKNINSDTILFSINGTIGNVAFYNNENIVLGKSVCYINPILEKLYPKYLYYYFKTKKTMDDFNRKSTISVIKNISLKTMRNFEIILPNDIISQKNICYILSLQEEQIENIKQLIKKIETRNQYYAEKLLSGELRVRKNENGKTEFYTNTEWQEDSLKSLFFPKEYSIPKGWKIEPILDNVKLVKGISINSSEFNYQGAGFQFLRTGDVWEDASSKKEPAFFDGVVDDKFIKTENDYVSCFEGFNKEIGNGTIGLVTNLGHGIVSSHLYKTENKNIDGKYYSVALLKTDYIQNILIRNAVGSTVLSSTKCLKDILFIFPDNDEMILIEEVLSSLYLESNNLRKVLEKESLRFQWLLDNLLSGEYQVVEE